MTPEQLIAQALDGTLTKFTNEGVRTEKVKTDHIPKHTDKRLLNRHAIIPDHGAEARRKPHRTRLDAAERAEIIALRRAGISVRNIAKRIGRCPGTVGVWLCRLNKAQRQGV